MLLALAKKNHLDLCLTINIYQNLLFILFYTARRGFI
jgi:hypothetical protein